MGRLPAVLLWMSLGAGLLSAQEPAITAISPGAFQPGQTQSITIHGGNLQNARNLWTSFPAQVVLDPDVAGNGMAADQVAFRVPVPPTTPIGVHGIRVITPGGASALKLCVVDDLPSVASTNPVSHDQPQVIPFLSAVDGTIANLTTHYYKFAVNAGQTISAEVLARRIGSPLDPTLRLLDARGRELAFNDDAVGLGGDCRFTYLAKEAGEFVLELRDVRYQGGAFRLRVGDFPCVTTPYPLAVMAGGQTPVLFVGPSLETAPLQLVAAPDAFLKSLPVSTKLPGGRSSGFATVAVAANAQFLEVEPNDSPEQANTVSEDWDLNGRFETSGDVDRFTLPGKKGETLILTGISRVQGSAADLMLKLLKKDGGQIAAVDDSGTAEGSITAVLPEDGPYTVVVEELSRRAGKDLTYRIGVSRKPQSFTLTASVDTLTIPAVGTAAVTVTATRAGYNGPIELSADRLPPGIEVSRAVLGPGRNVAVLTMTAAANAPQGTWQAFRLVGRARVNNEDLEVAADVSGSIRAKHSGVRAIPSGLNSEMLLGVGSPAPISLRLSQPEIVLGPHLSSTVVVGVTRAADADEAITLAISPEQNGVPPNVTVAVAPIEKGKNEIQLTISANDKAALGEFTVGLIGTHKKGNATVVQPVPSLRLRLEPVAAIAVELPANKVAKGGKLPAKLRLTRNPAFTGPVTVSLAGLPAGLTSPPVTIAPEATTADFELTAAADAPAATVPTVTAKAEAMIGQAKVEVTSPAVTVVVE